MKLDMSKVFDKVELSFLEKVILRLGFLDQWLILIMPCITTISYYVLINGELSDVIISFRGLR